MFCIAQVRDLVRKGATRSIAGAVGLGVLITLTPTAVRAQGCASEPPGVVNWWPAEGTSPNDARGLTDIRGTQTASIRNVLFSAGKVGQAFQFPGADMPNPGARYGVLLPGTIGPFSEMTIEGWINTSAAGTGAFQAVISSNQSDFVHLQLFDGNGNIVVFTDAGPVTLSLIPEGPTGMWRHIALTSKSGDTRLFVNGAQIAANSQTFTTITSSSSVWIGAGVCDAGQPCIPAGFGLANATGRLFQGLIDELTVFSRALSPAEIQQIIDADSGGKCKASRLISRIAQGASNWATEFQILTRPSATTTTTPISYTLRFFDVQGNPLPLPLLEDGASLGSAQSTVSGILQPNQSRFIETSVGASGSPIMAGYARLESTDPSLEVKSTLSNFFGGDINRGSRSSIPSISGFQRKLRLPIRSTNATAEFPELGQLNTCVAITSGGTQTLELLGVQKNGGSTCTNSTFSVTAGEHIAFCIKDASPPLGCLTNQDGTLEITAPQGAVAMAFTFDSQGRFYIQEPLTSGP